MSGDLPIARLRPGGRDNSISARSHTVPVTGQQPKTGAPLREWHAMASQQRDTAWKELVEWVVWLHDRYELATETRIPKCWHQHPGLIEELFALKVWREQIYTAEAPSGQAARYWHNEMRQVVQAATFYAKGCRSGHKTPEGKDQAAGNEALIGRWLAGDPMAAIPPELVKAAAQIPNPPPAMSDADMRAAIGSGLTRPIDSRIGDYQHYQGAWWMPFAGTGTWRQVPAALAAELDTTAERMGMADSLVEEHQRRNEDL